MPAIITSKFRIHNAKQLVESFSETAPDNSYIFIGGVTPWPDDVNPPTPTDTTQSTDFDVWKDLLSVKKITENDVSHVIPRHNWVSGTVYTEYDDTVPNITSQNIYVMNSNYYVYKVLSNNGNSPSTVEPLGSSTTAFETSDGYRWKFMYEISGAEALKFITPTHIPVKTLTVNDGSFQWNVQQAAVNGSVENIKIVSGGSNYNQNLNANVTSVANTSTFSISVSGSSASANTSFYTGSTIYVDGGAGIGQIVDVADYVVSGDVGTFTLAEDLTTPLSNVDSTIIVSPKIDITGNGTDLKAYATINAGEISTIRIPNIGTGYTEATANVVVSSAATAAGALGSGASLRPIISPFGGHGFDPIYELGGFYVMMNARLEYDENNDFTVKNDFRKLGLIVNPLDKDGNLATSLTYDNVYKITVSNPSASFSIDETVTGQTSGATGTVVDIDSGTGVLRLVNTVGTFVDGETITGNSSAVSSSISSIAVPELTQNSGNIVYIENRQPIARAVDQIEDIKLTIQF